MSQLLKSTEPTTAAQKPTGFQGNPDIKAALARASDALSAQEAALARAANLAKLQAQDDADARHRRARTKPGPRATFQDYCAC